MDTVCVWSGYRAAHESEILFVVFDGERIDALTYAPGGRLVEWTFYRARDGRAVVQEVRFGLDYDFGVVYVFGSITEACVRFAAEFARVDADIERVPNRAAAAREEPTGAQVLTLEEYVNKLKAAEE